MKKSSIYAFPSLPLLEDVDLDASPVKSTQLSGFGVPFNTLSISANNIQLDSQTPFLYDVTDVSPPIGHTVVLNEAGIEEPLYKDCKVLVCEKHNGIAAKWPRFDYSETDDYPFEAITFGETGSFCGLPYNDHNYVRSETTSAARQDANNQNSRLDLLAKVALFKDDNLASPEQPSPSPSRFWGSRSFSSPFESRDCHSSSSMTTEEVGLSGRADLVLNRSFHHQLPPSTAASNGPSTPLLQSVVRGSTSTSRAIVVTPGGSSMPIQIRRINVISANANHGEGGGPITPGGSTPGSTTAYMLYPPGASRLHRSIQGQGLVPASSASRGAVGTVRCICGYTHDDGYLIQCDKCKICQHVDCVLMAPSSLPQNFLCNDCHPRPVNYNRAVNIQRQKLSRQQQWSKVQQQPQQQQAIHYHLPQQQDQQQAQRHQIVSIAKQRPYDLAPGYSRLQIRQQPASPRTSKRKQDFGNFSDGGVMEVRSPPNATSTLGASGISLDLMGSSSGSGESLQGVSRRGAVPGVPTSGSGGVLSNSYLGSNGSVRPLMVPSAMSTPAPGNHEDSWLLTSSSGGCGESGHRLSIGFPGPEDDLVCEEEAMEETSSSEQPEMMLIGSSVVLSPRGQPHPGGGAAASRVVPGHGPGRSPAHQHHQQNQNHPHEHQQQPQHVFFPPTSSRSSSPSQDLLVTTAGLTNGGLDQYEEAGDNRYSERLRRLLTSHQFNLYADPGLNPHAVLGLASGTPSSGGGAGRVRRCHVVNFEFNRQGLKASQNLHLREPVIEYKGVCMPFDEYGEEYDYRKHYNPFVLFYDKFDGLQLCIDARYYGNEARFIRRSCNPNCEVRHMAANNQLRLFVVASQSIVPGSELTLPFDFDYTKCRYQVYCACGKKGCLVTRWYKRQERHQPLPENAVIRMPRMSSHRQSDDLASWGSQGANSKRKALQQQQQQSQQQEPSVEEGKKRKKKRLGAATAPLGESGRPGLLPKQQRQRSTGSGRDHQHQSEAPPQEELTSSTPVKEEREVEETVQQTDAVSPGQVRRSKPGQKQQQALPSPPQKDRSQAHNWTTRRDWRKKSSVLPSPQRSRSNDRRRHNSAAAASLPADQIAMPTAAISREQPLTSPDEGDTAERQKCALGGQIKRRRSSTLSGKETGSTEKSKEPMKQAREDIWMLEVLRRIERMEKKQKSHQKLQSDDSGTGEDSMVKEVVAVTADSQQLEAIKADVKSEGSLSGKEQAGSTRLRRSSLRSECSTTESKQLEAKAEPLIIRYHRPSMSELQDEIDLICSALPEADISGPLEPEPIIVKDEAEEKVDELSPSALPVDVSLKRNAPEEISFEDFIKSQDLTKVDTNGEAADMQQKKMKRNIEESEVADNATSPKRRRRSQTSHSADNQGLSQAESREERWIRAQIRRIEEMEKKQLQKILSQQQQHDEEHNSGNDEAIGQQAESSITADTSGAVSDSSLAVATVEQALAEALTAEAAAPVYTPPVTEDQSPIAAPSVQTISSPTCQPSPKLSPRISSPSRKHAEHTEHPEETTTLFVHMLPPDHSDMIHLQDQSSTRCFSEASEEPVDSSSEAAAAESSEEECDNAEVTIMSPSSSQHSTDPQQSQSRHQRARRQRQSHADSESSVGGSSPAKTRGAAGGGTVRTRGGGGRRRRPGTPVRRRRSVTGQGAPELSGGEGLGLLEDLSGGQAVAAAVAAAAERAIRTKKDMLENWKHQEEECSLIVYRERETNPMEKFSRSLSISFPSLQASAAGVNPGSLTPRPTKKRWLTQALMDSGSEERAEEEIGNMNSSSGIPAHDRGGKPASPAPVGPGAGGSFAVPTPPACGISSTWFNQFNPKKRLISQFSSDDHEQQQQLLTGLAGSLSPLSPQVMAAYAAESLPITSSPKVPKLPPKKAGLKKAESDEYLLHEMRKVRVSLTEYRRRRAREPSTLLSSSLDHGDSAETSAISGQADPGRGEEEEEEEELELEQEQEQEQEHEHEQEQEQEPDRVDELLSDIDEEEEETTARMPDGGCTAEEGGPHTPPDSSQDEERELGPRTPSEPADDKEEIEEVSLEKVGAPQEEQSQGPRTPGTPSSPMVSPSHEQPEDVPMVAQEMCPIVQPPTPTEVTHVADDSGEDGDKVAVADATVSQPAVNVEELEDGPSSPPPPRDFPDLDMDGGQGDELRGLQMILQRDQEIRDWQELKTLERRKTRLLYQLRSVERKIETPAVANHAGAVHPESQTKTTAPAASSKTATQQQQAVGRGSQQMLDMQAALQTLQDRLKAQLEQVRQQTAATGRSSCAAAAAVPSGVSGRPAPPIVPTGGPTTARRVLGAENPNTAAAGNRVAPGGQQPASQSQAIVPLVQQLVATLTATLQQQASSLARGPVPTSSSGGSDSGSTTTQAQQIQQPAGSTRGAAASHQQQQFIRRQQH